MNRLITGLFLAVIIAGIGGFAATTERASAAQQSIECAAIEVGHVSCTLTVTELPEPLGDFTLKLDITYNDVDGDGGPSAGDRIKCVTVSGTTPSGQTIGNSRQCQSGTADPTAEPPPPTATAEPPTPTAEPPTATAEPPTVTPTATDEPPPPTATDVPPTATEVPPTATEEPPTPTATATATLEPA